MKFRRVTTVFIALIITLVAGQKNKKDNDEGPKEFVCPETLGGNYADPVTCRRFYQCVNGYPYMNTCPSQLYFDDIGKFCTFKAEARCGPLPATPAPATESPADLAQPCDLSVCKLPYCFCSSDGTKIPDNLNPKDTPQMIMLTFSGAVNLNNYEQYQKVFKSKLRSNGCPLKGTFFISHEYSNYQMIQSLAHEGHEIALETISLQKGLEDKGYEEWVGEMIGMREILHNFANISRRSINGMRAPYLKPGRNTQYEVMSDFGFLYDSSIGISPLNVPIWPYTLDYKIPQECKSGTCPTKPFRGIWELPLNSHYIAGYEGGHCPYLDQCVLHSHDADDVLEWLVEDFERYYNNNRAPYMMPFHTNWFQSKALVQGLMKFLDWALQQPDVYVVTMSQAVAWMETPTATYDLKTFEPWTCKSREELPEAPCNISKKCALLLKTTRSNISEPRYMETCFECPNRYPWLGDAKGTGQANDIYNPDVYSPEENDRLE